MDPLFEPDESNPEPGEVCNELRHMKLMDFRIILTELRAKDLEAYKSLVTQVRAYAVGQAI